MLKVELMTNREGIGVVNQFVIFTDEGDYFQSCDCLIVFIPKKGRIQLDIHFWDCFWTTRKYRDLFLGETGEDTEKKIASGEYLLKDLNR